MRSICTCVALATTLSVCLPVASAQGVTLVRRTQAEAEQAAKSGSIEAAAAKYRKLVFAGYRKAHAGYVQLQTKRIKGLLREAKGLREADPARAIAILKQAHGHDPGNRAVKKELKRHGLTYYHGAFHSRADLEQAKTRESKRGDERRTEIGLTRDFRLRQRGPFRFYSNLDPRYGAKVLGQMMNAVEAHYAKYSEVMRPAGIVYPKAGLDVVLFKSEREYQAHVRTPGSAGLYDPRRGVGYFYAGRAGFNFTTLLHEMTHQLNDKLLGGTRFTPWFEEGIAEYFGSGVLSQGGRRITLGRPEAGRMVDFREMLLAKPSRTASLEQFFGMSAQLSSGYYAQSWALVHYLMTGPVQGKLIVFDLIQAGKAKQKAKGATASLNAQEMAKILSAYRLDPAQLEASYTAFYLGK